MRWSTLTCVMLTTLVAGVSSSLAVVRTQDQVLVPTGAIWRYLDDGSEPRTAWREPGFVDSAWNSGPAKLGYGDRDVVTTVGHGPDERRKFVTTYFRHTFNLDTPGAFKRIVARLLRDDGAVVYLNGNEVWRSNMPAGTITATTLATTASDFTSPDDVTWGDTALAPGMLRAGGNVLAVEVHQYHASSSDIGFDFELIGSTRESGPVVTTSRDAAATSPTQTARTAKTATIAPVTDGPYVRWHVDTAATILVVCNDTVHSETARAVEQTVHFTAPCAVSEPIVLTGSPPAAEPATFNQVRRIFAISDVEGEYDAFVALLEAAGVLDAGHRWAWGDGHLVLVGDMVDRGDKVTEVLWLIHRLEQEASRAGGRVHYVLGNHDAMLLYGDHRYVAQKYLRVAGQLGTPLLELFGPTTELGRWMRSKPVMLRIDSVLFVHGGVAPTFAAEHESLDAVNASARAGLLEPARRSDPEIAPVFDSDGPLWYRGYFRASDPEPAALDEALARYGARTIVVGHTVVDSIARLHGGRVIGIDATFRERSRVEGLLLEDGRFYRVAITGERKPLE